jgi:hypothetical protein
MDPREGRQGGTGTRREQAQLSDCRIAIILTCVPGSPNNEERLHAVTVQPSDVEKDLGYALGPCSGPPARIRIGPEILAARYAWRDQDADALDALVGVGKLPGALPGAAARFAATKLRPMNEGDLLEAARAATAAVYAASTDRMLGAISTALNPSLSLQGNVAGVTHTLNPTGDATTTIALPAEPPPLDYLSVLPEGICRRLLGLVNRESVHS